MKTLNDIRQCDIFNNAVLKSLMNYDPVKLDVSYSDNSFCVVITQDCDIVHTKTEDEPFVEFIIGNPTNDKSCKNGKNPRKLHLENNEKTFEFIVHNRFFVKKEKLSDYKFTDSNGLGILTAENKKILKKWLGNRYIRAAFPDKFNERLSKANITKKLLDKAISSKVSHIFFEVEDRELSKEETYTLNVMVVVDASDPEKIHIEDAYNDYFKDIEGIESYVSVVTEDEVTLKDLRNYKRWDKDSISFSKTNQSSPVEVIDQV